MTHDAVPAQHMPLLFHGGVPISISAPTKSIRFLRLHDSNLSLSNRRYQDQEQSAAWYAACGMAFSDKPSLVIRRSRVSHASLPDPVVKRSSEARRLCPGTSTHVQG